MDKIFLLLFLISVFSSNAQQSNNIENKVFIAGSETHFDNLKKCDFYFECDCCSGEYVFLSDNKFIFIYYCSSDYVLTGGNYVISPDSVILKSTNRRIEINYNWEREVDENAQRYFINDTTVNSYKISFAIDKCDKTILVENKKHDSWIAQETSSNSKEIFKHFESIGLLSYLENFFK